MQRRGIFFDGIGMLLISFSVILATGCSVVHVKDRGESAKAEKKVQTRSELFSARKSNELKKRLVVMPFLNVSSYDVENVGVQSREKFIQELEKTNEVIVLEPSSVGITQLDQFQNGTGYNTPELARRLRAGGVHAIVVGTIKDLRTGKTGDSVGVFRKVRAQVKATVQIQVISARSGKVMLEETREADTSETSVKVGERAFSDMDKKDSPEMVKLVLETALEKAVMPVVDSLKKFSWEGRIALVKGEKVYLNAGRLSGLQVGDILQIVEGVDEVFDPETSQSIGTIKGRMKGTVEVVSYFGNDGAVTLIHSGSGFKENDLVEFY